MRTRLVIGAAVLAGLAYLFVLTWSMTNTTYDVWGALIAVPPYGLIGVLFVRATFKGDLADLERIMYFGLAAKLLGAATRYWVGFAAYDGFIDAQRYHDYAVSASTDVWAGQADLFSVFPGGTGTQFTEGLTALVYVMTGPSKMSGFVVFSLLAFIGTAYFVKAACLAVPGLMTRRYALLCVLAPSLVYWPSSIGKDALLIFLLGIATYGIARILSQEALTVPVLMVAAGLIGAAYIRPHMVGIWLGGAFPALLVALLRGRDPWGRGVSRPLNRALLIPIIFVAGVGLVLVSLATVRYLDPGAADDEAASSITSIVDETTRRTVQAGSAFEPPDISNPARWPYASVRTLTRPLLIEARGAAQLFTALELSIFLGLCAVSWRRLLSMPKLIFTYPYVAFAMTTMFLCGLAFTSFANLAILARQRSIVMAFMLLIVCLPAVRGRSDHKTGPPSPARTFERLGADDDGATVVGSLVKPAP